MKESKQDTIPSTKQQISKRWLKHPQQPEVAKKISEKLSISPIIAQILLNRQLNSLSQVDAFLNPISTTTHHFQEEDLKKIVSLIQDAIKTQGLIFVYGDYDVDGMTSTAIMASFLQECGAQVEYYIPNRFTDGYGLSETIIQKLKQKDYKYLFTLDCGITNIKEITQIKEEVNCEIAILDHHTIPDTPPPADIIINPKSLTSDHPFWDLCTAGIVYKVIQHYCHATNTSLNVENYLDLVALGTIADIAQMKGENRVLTQQGLKKLNQRKRAGIYYLLEATKFKKEFISSRDVGFVIAPKLNAAGRLKHAQICVDLLITKNKETAQQIATQLITLNQERQKIGQNMLIESIKYVEGPKHSPDMNAITIAGPNWHSGIIGITAA